MKEKLEKYQKTLSKYQLSMYADCEDANRCLSEYDGYTFDFCRDLIILTLIYAIAIADICRLCF